MSETQHTVDDLRAKAVVYADAGRFVYDPHTAELLRAGADAMDEVAKRNSPLTISLSASDIKDRFTEEEIDQAYSDLGKLPAANLALVMRVTQMLKQLTKAEARVKVLEEALRGCMAGLEADNHEGQQRGCWVCDAYNKARAALENKP